jgi:RNase adaptor protein for sRNA GlmZ degradation
MSKKTIIQFGYNVRVPQDVVAIIDCRGIANPYPKYAHDRVAARWQVRNDPLFEGLVSRAMNTLEMYNVIGIGCGYGVHRSGAVVQEVTDRLERLGFDVEVENWGKA